MNFFSNSSPLKDFLNFTDDKYYVPAPPDWWVVITDIRGSTKAIEEGRYKEVNMAGASCIAGLSNALPGIAFPFVFGGDGATALIPGSEKTNVEAALRSIQKIISSSMNLEMRVGLVSVNGLTQRGHEIQVCRFDLSGGPHLAFFKGDGLEAAEKLVKDGKYLLSEGPEWDSEKVLEGLSCRWAPIKSQRGKMLSLLIKARNGDNDVLFKKIAQDIHAIVDLDSPDSHPVKSTALKGQTLRKSILLEAKMSGRGVFSKNTLRLLFEFFIAKLLLKTGWKPKGFDMRAYTESIAPHSDFRKYDELLRMVLDCSSEMIAKIEVLLESEFQQGRIFYGLFQSNAALMTCFVRSTSAGEHLHFIDGSDGGYAMAAKQMKAQMKAST